MWTFVQVFGLLAISLVPLVAICSRTGVSWLPNADVAEFLRSIPDSSSLKRAVHIGAGLGLGLTALLLAAPVGNIFP